MTASSEATPSGAILRKTERYWIEARKDRKSPWVAWREGPEPALEREYERLAAEYPGKGWRFGKTTEVVEVLDAV